MDSGCSRHMTGNKSLLSNFSKEKGPIVSFGGNGKGVTKGYGSVSNGTITFSKVAHVEGLMYNLLSISQICDLGYKVMFQLCVCLVFDVQNKVVLAGTRMNDVYIINMKESAIGEAMCLLSQELAKQSWLWHKRFSHLNFKTLNKLSNKDLVVGMPKIVFEKEKLCGACEKGKLTKASFKSKQCSSISQPLQMLHMDLCGPVSTPSLGGKKYMLVIVDEYSRYTWVFFLKHKSDAAEEIIRFVRLMENLNDQMVKSIRSDNGTEFRNATLEEFFDSKGISQNFSAVRTPQQNGVVERKNRTLCEAARSMLSDAKLPTYFWAEAINTACFTQNRSLIVKRHDKTPYEVFHGRKPTVDYFHVFGCACHMLNDREQLGKFDPKSDDGIFVGYSLNSRAFRIYNLRRKCIDESMHVKFDDFETSSFSCNEDELNIWINSCVGEIPSTSSHTTPQEATDPSPSNNIPFGKACLIGPVYSTFWLSRFFADMWMLFLKKEEYVEWFEKARFKDVQIKRIGPKWYRGVCRHGLIMR